MPRIAIWAADNQLRLIERALAEGPSENRLEAVIVGCEDQQAADSLAETLGAGSATNDVREVLQSAADLVWLAAPRTLDTDTRSMVRGANMPVATSAPPPAALPDLLSEPDGGMPALFIPLMRSGEAFRSASTALENFGDVHCIHVSSTAGDHQTSRSALALDAFDLVTHIMGTPDEIWAAHAGSLPVSPDPTVERSGHLTAAMRFGTERAASITVSDGGGTWIRRIVILGEGGRIIVTDEGVSWTDPDGKAQEAPPTEGQANAGELAGWHLRRIAAGGDTPTISLNAAIVLESARLSCLTRQVEDPQHVRNMLGRG
ncbi:MAG: hypothetical protein GY894_07960 [Planctomycetes bacterium]|jgi:hypothetical protein|nr:hypothetical protein [Planctomycetota bacterium]MCP4839281.1 hypothetical protein [Planctomycetota bacterium]